MILIASVKAWKTIKKSITAGEMRDGNTDGCQQLKCWRISYEPIGTQTKLICEVKERVEARLTHINHTCAHTDT